MIVKEQTFYEAVEKGGAIPSSILLENPNSKIEKLRWCRFKTYDGAKRAVEKAIQDRKRQYSYFRDADGNLISKISYYERYNLTYKIYKVIEKEEVVYETSNSDEEKKTPDETLQEEIPLTL